MSFYDASRRVRALRATYYAVPIPCLMALLGKAGFVDVKRIDGAFFQPLLMARKATTDCRPGSMLP